MIFNLVSITKGNSFIDLPASDLLEHDFPTDPIVKDVITAPISPMDLSTPPSARKHISYFNDPSFNYVITTETRILMNNAFWN